MQKSSPDVDKLVRDTGVCEFEDEEEEEGRRS